MLFKFNLKKIYEKMANFKSKSSGSPESNITSKWNIEKEEVILQDNSWMWKFWLVWVIVIYVSYILFQSLNLVYLIIAAYIISIAMETVILFFEKYKFISRWLAILISYILLFLFVISAFLILIPFVANQSVEILKHIIERFQLFQNDLQQYWLEYIIQNSSYIPDYFKWMFLSLLGDKQTILIIQQALQENIAQILSSASNYVTNIWWFVVNLVWWFFSTIFQIVFVFILAIFFSLEKNRVILFLASISWNKIFVYRKLVKLYTKLWYRLKWQILLSLYVGFSVLIGLYILKIFGVDLPSKFTLALIAALTEIIPIVGPILWWIPAVLVAAVSEGFLWVLAVIAMYAIIQFLENNILIPLVMNQALGVSPLVIFIAMVLWWASFGFVGVVLAVPIAVILTLIFEDFLSDNNK